MSEKTTHSEGSSLCVAFVQIGAKTLAISTSTITMELTGGDLTTEHAGAALGTVGKPIGLRVCFSAAL